MQLQTVIFSKFVGGVGMTTMKTLKSRYRCTYVYANSETYYWNSELQPWRKDLDNSLIFYWRNKSKTLKSSKILPTFEGFSKP